jgi:hypothetical protein
VERATALAWEISIARLLGLGNYLSADPRLRFAPPIATHKTALILTLKSDSDIASKRILKREQASAHRWHLEVKLETPEQVDGEILAWITKAYELAA